MSLLVKDIRDAVQNITSSILPTGQKTNTLSCPRNSNANYCFPTASQYCQVKLAIHPAKLYGVNVQIGKKSMHTVRE